MSRTGILLANLGTPEAPRRKEVARFLREFLSDPRVVDLPRIFWLPLLYCVIVPLRAGRSAEAYREIWWPEGSPLLVLTQRLATRLQEALNGPVVAGMRYGQPSIRRALDELRGQDVERLVVLPLYPQYSGTTTASIADDLEQSLAAIDWQPELHFIEDYHRHRPWVRAVAERIRAYQAEHGEPQKLVFSLHGIPQRYVRQGDVYQDHCQASVEAIAAELGLDHDQWMLCFQSRVGREPWLQPYTDEVLQALPSQGVRHVQVVCPGFAVDCLETLEEIALRNAEDFVDAGGEKLDYIPALNDSEEHAAALAALVQQVA